MRASSLDHLAVASDAAGDRGQGNAGERDGHADGEPDGEGEKEAGIKRDDRGQHGDEACDAADEEKDKGHLHSPRLCVLS